MLRGERQRFPDKPKRKLICMGVDKILGNIRDVVGTIEDTVLNSKLVDGPKAHFEQIVGAWAPTHTPERRRFF